MTEPVYVGLDLGSRSCFVVAVDQRGTTVKRERFATSEANLIAAFDHVPGEIQVHLEAGELAGWARQILKIQERVERVVVGHAKSNRWVAQDPLKGDRVDAFKLANLLRMGQLHEVYYPDDARRREFKQVVRHYDDMTDEEVRLKQKIKSRLRCEGIIVQTKAIYQPEGFEAVLPRIASRHVRQALEQLFELLQETLKAQANAKRLMGRVAKQFPEIAHFCELPGAALISGSRFSAYIQTPHRFHTKRQLWRYCRLGITDRTSDGRRLGYQRLDRTGNGRLKDVSRTIFEGAMKRKEENAFQRTYRRSLERTHNETHARLTTQRKILAVMWTMWKEGRPYCDEMG